MANRASYSCTALMGSNKCGKIKADSKGYYPMVLGAFDFPNHNKAVYPYAAARHTLEGSGSFMRRVKSGQCRGEYGHPRPQGMKNSEWLQRVLAIHEDKISHHIRSFVIDKTSVRDKSGKPVIAVIGDVKPVGPYADSLREQILNPDENVAFSVRAITNDRVVRGVLNKLVKTIVTYDYVNEPGIEIATKYNAPSLESLVETIPFTERTLDIACSEMSEASMESQGFDVDMIKTELGWSKTQIITPSLSW